ncbi:MAG: tetratricopeptide repeat protein [Verrucomicrobiaceae bacterium]|nr:tetratricopeptide repeat protein [Verrucomicrobiaceae bacterium]
MAVRASGQLRSDLEQKIRGTLTLGTLDRNIAVPAFNNMAENPAILRSDKGAATSLALWTLAVLILIQVGLLVWGWVPLWQRQAESGKAAPVSLQNTAKTVEPSAAVPRSTSAFTASLPPPPQMLGTVPAAAAVANQLPPPPTLPPALATGTPKLPPGPVLAPPPPTKEVATAAAPPPAAPPAVLMSPTRTDFDSQPAPPFVPTPEVQTSATGVPEVDELLATAKETLSLGDATAAQAALETLKRADLRLPEHPAVLREMALAHQKLGDTAKAQELFDRANAAASRSPTLPSGASANGFPASTDAFDPAPTSPPPPVAGPVSLGACKVAQDLTCNTGERRVLRMEVKATPGMQVNAENINIDVFFYDRVDGSKVEQSKCDKPAARWQLPVDFANGGVEYVDIDYHMPRLSETELKEHGRRTYYGFVAKLYYEGKFMAETAEPRGLRSRSDGSPAQP